MIYINLYKFYNRASFDSFVNKLKKYYNESQFITLKDKNEERLEQSVNRFGPSPKKEKIYNFRAKPVNNQSFENFIKVIETDIFRPDNYQRICK